MLPRTAEQLVAVLAAYRIGAVVVPLFGALGQEAVQFRIEASDADVAITNPGASHLFGINMSNVVTNLLDEAESCLGDEDSPHDYGRNEIHSMLFTSGTSGSPKGVPIPLKAMDAFDQYMIHGIGLTKEDAYLSLAGKIIFSDYTSDC